MQSLYTTLEFDRIREKLAQCASSPLGKEQCQKIESIEDSKLLRQALAQTAEMRDILDYDQALPVDGILDIRDAIKRVKIEGAQLVPQSLCAIAQTMAVARRLVSYFSSRYEKIPELKKIAQKLVSLEDLEKEIFRCIDESSYELKDEATPELASLRRQIDRAQALARKKIESMLRSLSSQGVLQENVIALRNGRLVLVVKEEFRHKIKGLIHDQSSSGSSLFIEPLDTLEDNNRARALQAQEAKEIERILHVLTNLVRKNLQAIVNNIRQLGLLDYIYAKAAFSRMLNAHQPELAEDVSLQLALARHPLLLLRMGEDGAVPLSVEIGEGKRTLIISGPNAGGKTVALKTIGLLTLMARCGLFIPALPHSKIGRIGRIFAAIGDQQSIDNDLSTFSSHLENLKVVAEEAEYNSLVLIDEIGSGTDPEEGTALAMSLLEKLTKTGSLTVVTTHQSVLKAFAYRTDGVENASMEFDVNTLKPTYRFRTGIPGSSYAFEIARRMGLENSIIMRARGLVGEQKDRLEGLILELEGKIQKYNELSRETGLKESEYRGLLKLYRERSDYLAREEKAIKRKAIEEAEDILKQANASVENAIREIKERAASKQAIRQAKAALIGSRSMIENAKKQAQENDEQLEEEELTSQIELGDTVRWEVYNNTGIVISEPDKQNRVLLQLDGIKIKAPLKELRKAAPQKHKRSKVVRVQIDKSEGYKDEVDLRGLRAEEALDRVDLFLDEAMLAGFATVRIIHGKGTGRLRERVTAFLRDNPRVYSIRFGNWNEGDVGVTIAELK